MISLSDYFQPLLPYGFVFYFLIFFFFDALGTFLKKRFISSKNNSKIINWIIGLGFFIFIWFLASLFIPYSRNNILISILILSLITMPEYIRDGELRKFIVELWSLKIPILIIAPLLPAVFVKASLPPYYSDEMAYHFISPSDLFSLDRIRYTGGLYADLPRIMDLFYSIMFSLTKTYSVARLFHFTILASSMLFSYKILKKNFGILVGFLFVFVFFSLPQDIVLTSTLGYIDVASYSLLLIGLIASVDFITGRKLDSLYLAAVFWAMNLGTKYTGLTAFVSFLVVAGVAVIIKRKRFQKVFHRKIIFKIAILGIVFGGYWYIKNFVLYGNPIFPFLLPCFEKYASMCGANSSFFEGWTMAITLGNAFQIIKQLFSSHLPLQILIVSIPAFLLVAKSRARFYALLLTLPVFIELFVLKYFSGFYIRYQQYMQLYLLGALLILISNREILKERLAKALVLVVFVSSAFMYFHTVKYTNSLGFLNWYEIKYSINKINIYDWIDWKFPEMKYTLNWCENPPGGERTALGRLDPDLIWFDYSGLMRSFVTNCYFSGPGLEAFPLDEVLAVAKENKMQFYIASPWRCISDEDVKPKYEYERDYQFKLRQVNNKVICNAEEIKPNLYYFDYEKI